MFPGSTGMPDIVQIKREITSNTQLGGGKASFKAYQKYSPLLLLIC